VQKTNKNKGISKALVVLYEGSRQLLQTIPCSYAMDVNDNKKMEFAIELMTQLGVDYTEGTIDAGGLLQKRNLLVANRVFELKWESRSSDASDSQMKRPASSTDSLGVSSSSQKIQKLTQGFKPAIKKKVRPQVKDEVKVVVDTSSTTAHKKTPTTTPLVLPADAEALGRQLARHTSSADEGEEPYKSMMEEAEEMNRYWDV
jgi:hypothetical protein